MCYNFPIMENRKDIAPLTEDEKAELSRQATAVYAQHGFNGHQCSVWVDDFEQWLYVRLDTADDFHVLGKDEADLAMERLDLFFEREARNARMAMDRRADISAAG